MGRTIYIAGRMSGLPNNGYDAFNRKATQLRACLLYTSDAATSDLE